MTLTHRFVSVSMLGAIVLASAPFVGAQGFGQDLTDEKRQEIRADLQACRDNNEDQADRKACADAIFESNGINRPERGPRGNTEDRPALPEGAKEALMACHDNNEEHEDKKACAEEVAEKFGFTLPEMGPKMNKGRKIGHEFRSSITESCGERADTDEWKTCAKEARTGAVQEMREEHPRATKRFTMRRRFKGLDDESKEDLKACRNLETRDEKKACFDAVRDQIDSE